MNPIATALSLAATHDDGEITLEEMLTSPDYFGLTTATPMQRAVCRMADGLPLGDLAHAPLLQNPHDYPDEVVKRATWDWCVGDLQALPRTRPAEVHLLAGIRTFKSLFAAANLVRNSRFCDAGKLGPGEVPRATVTSIKIDLARVVIDHAVGRCMASPVLSTWMAGEPATESFGMQHQIGLETIIKALAGSRAGANLVAYWNMGAVFDEFPRMVGSSDGKVVNFDHARDAVQGRLLAGAQILGIGSPWAPFGPAYESVQSNWQHPSDELVVLRAPAPVLNPFNWTPEKVWKLKSVNPRAYQTDVLCEFADLAEALFPAALLESCKRVGRAEKLPRENGRHYVAAMDPATRSNAWTLAIASLDVDGKVDVAHVEQWLPRGGQNLSPRDTLKSISEVVREYGATTVYSDQYHVDSLRDLAAPFGLNVIEDRITGPRKQQLFEGLRVKMEAGLITVPNNRGMMEDIRRVSRRVTQTGVTIDLPHTADGRHCDYAPCVAMAVDMARTPPSMYDPMAEQTTHIDDYECDLAEQYLEQRAELEAAVGF